MIKNMMSIKLCINDTTWDINIDTLKEIKLLYEIHTDITNQDTLSLKDTIVTAEIFQDILDVLEGKHIHVTKCNTYIIQMIHKSDMLKCDNVTNILCEVLAERMKKMSLEELRTIYLSW